MYLSKRWINTFEALRGRGVIYVVGERALIARCSAPAMARRVIIIKKQ